MKITLYSLLIIACYSLAGCDPKKNNNDKETKEQEVEDSDNGCKFEDGSHSATVDYYNPETGHSATYTLDVEVENCEVTQIDFPNGGWLDDSHITPTELDDNGDIEKWFVFRSKN